MVTMFSATNNPAFGGISLSYSSLNLCPATYLTLSITWLIASASFIT